MDVYSDMKCCCSVPAWLLWRDYLAVLTSIARENELVLQPHFYFMDVLLLALGHVRVVFTSPSHGARVCIQIQRIDQKGYASVKRLFHEVIEIAMA